MFIKPQPPQKSPYKYNLAASTPDARDYLFKSTVTELRKIVDLREFDSAIKDQGQLGSCSANTITSTYENLILRKYPTYFKELSRLYLYYHSRLIEHSVYEDSGVYTLRSNIKAMHKYSICAESFWPYNIEKFKHQPSPDAYSDAPQRNITGYANLTDNDQIVMAVNDNYPVVVGLSVFAGFNNLTKENSVIPMPTEDEESVGAHSLSIVGYNIPERTFLAKNSFGEDWGDGGYCTIPFDYANQYFFEKWVFDITNQQLNYEG